jgi:hypothetical protein
MWQMPLRWSLENCDPQNYKQAAPMELRMMSHTYFYFLLPFAGNKLAPTALVAGLAALLVAVMSAA